MPSGLVLITGAGGYIGFAVLCKTLRKGYYVRLAVRSIAKGDAIASAPFLETLGLQQDQITFVTIPDFTVPHAFDEAARDCKYIIHVASPLPTALDAVTENNEETFVGAAKEGTLAILKAARAAGTVERVVITTSYTAMRTLDAMFGPASADVLTAAESRIPDVSGPYPVDMVAYPASKIAALNASEAWMKEHGQEIGFDLVSIAPSFVLGRNEQAQKPDDLLTSTTLLLLNMLLGLHSPSPLPSSVAHIDDVAHVHVASLDAKKIPGNRVYLVSSDGLKGAAWATAKEIVKENFPQALKKQWFVLTGTQPTVWNTVDASETEKLFGIVHKGFETQVKDTVAQFIELKKMEEK
ncbi:hypothetical protein LTR35_017769 [Friedmanniomyces endolithicus]|uniref:NAD-dependent epimerase/dehydratase domain-containing protein n=1 Tax=Friedmanniomyces endolithicus TaxID=329885 RepID=A0AAN6F467_9PEZI|nr:hypothetical protein LTR35_017769 [Friedmanniomyces endolithicus]KAK0262740.1 hypothetical protein LTS00_018100 [Friedmanniomyces endolithicus]KAK0301529.1 hypothetical protein LTR82_018274 [Friedmanniomyces endolithicus]KAK0968619.1 hypothetical protein LTR54_018184 [Friedmanniomyces endolithicus]